MREFDFSRYFRATGDLAFYNTGMGVVRALAKRIVRAHRGVWTVNHALAFADVSMRDRHLEVKALGIAVIGAYRREFTPRLLAVWKRWLAGGQASNWATTDDICGSLIGPLLIAHPHVIPAVAGWRTHRSMWLRRASAVAMIKPIASGDALDAAYAVVAALHADHNDLIQKAAGWMLREAGKADPDRLERYLRRNGRSIPRTTVRYAIERFSARKRRALLRATAGIQ